ncbi:MAG: low molecular weight protein-tyrosine-phosphatase [Alphaproteobacteria bacterium]
MAKILFVCTGNICRSPTAEVVLRELARRADKGPPIHVESAGTHEYHIGEPADGRAIATAQDHGFDLTEHRARSVSAQDYQEFDYIIALDHGHLRILKRQCPAGQSPRIELLMNFAPQRSEQEVPDPYYGDRTDYEQSFQLIEAACRGMLNTLAQGSG